MTGSKNTELIPVFISGGFRFSGEPPRHIESKPIVASSLGVFSVFGVVTYDETRYLLATDIPDEPTAMLIAKARENYLEDMIPRMGYTDDVLIMRPDFSEEVAYSGRAVREY